MDGAQRQGPARRASLLRHAGEGAGDFGGFLTLWGHRVPEALRQGDGVAVDADLHRHDQVRGRPRQAEPARQRQRRQHMGAVEMAERQAVAQGRPGRLGGEVEFEALRSGESEFVRHDQRRGIAERDVAELEPHPSRSAVVTIARAMSAILRFSFMALRRSCLYASSSVRPFMLIRMPLARSINLRSASSPRASVSSR